MYDNSDMDDFETVRKLVRDGRPWPVSLLTRAFRQLPQWTGRRNLNGIPICVYVVSEIPIKSVLSVQQRDPNLSSVFLPAEYMTQFVQPLCGQMTPDGVQVTRSVNIVDLSGVGVGMFWNLRKLLQTSSSMATAHYPESVERIFVCQNHVLGFSTAYLDLRVPFRACSGHCLGTVKDATLRLLTLCRSLVPHPSFLRFGALSSDGSNQRRHRRLPYFQMLKSQAPLRNTSTLQMYLDATAEPWSGSLETTHC